MVAIIDYDAGNIKSVEKALIALGDSPVVTRDKEQIRRADHVILPGVGAFGDCMQHLQDYDLTEVIRETIRGGKPFLGICVGMQLLFEGSEESPEAPGLGILKGRFYRFRSDTEKIPHMGWNSIRIREGARILRGIGQNPYMYFVHSYYLKADDPSIVTATCDYIHPFDASVELGNCFGTQFHPEKSSRIGLKVLKNFLEVR
ncbi:MAG: imidazole glycerol phosphate synthase subunit HisH [Lachnospiraceae bacterium]|nr:imidazole glycerol phosphate synthase subunit HisH [Lachnospiraceae bacterium]